MTKTTLAVAALALLAGVGGTVAWQTHAQTTGVTAATSTSNTTQSAAFDPTKGGHVGQNGVREELLTGDTAEKVKAAALAAVSGGTIQRVETDAEGAAYEAHMTKSDGSPVTVKLDANFNVTATEAGRGK